MPGLPTNRSVAAPPNVTMGHSTYDVIARRRNPHWGGAGESHPAHPQWRTTASVPTSPANGSPLTPTPTPSPATPSPISPVYPNVITLSVLFIIHPSIHSFIYPSFTYAIIISWSFFFLFLLLFFSLLFLFFSLLLLSSSSSWFINGIESNREMNKQEEQNRFLVSVSIF